jgi:hypothetical protein
MYKFRDAMRRVITGDNARGESVIIIDGGPERGRPCARADGGYPEALRAKTAPAGPLGPSMR